MPLKPGASPSVISHNISEMVASGHSREQALAAALHNAHDKKSLVTATGQPLVGPNARNDSDKVSPASVKYTKESPNPSVICAKCAFFIPGGSCQKVAGTIADEGWCKLFTLSPGMKAYQAPRPFTLLEMVGKRLKAGVQVKRGEDGLRYMFIITSNSYKDREDEAMTTKALKRYVEQSWKGNKFVADQPYRFWHDDKLPKLGDIVWADMNGPFLTEVAREANNNFAHKCWDYIEKNPKGWGTSHGFNYPVAKQKDGVYHEIEKFETSLLPLWAAANPYTMSVIVGGKMGSSENRDSVLDKILGRPGKSKQYRKVTDSLAAALDEAGIKHKSFDANEDEQLVKDLQLVYEMHKAKKKPMMHDEPDGDEAEDEKDMEEDEKAQPGYGEMDDSAPDDRPDLVAGSITKRPGSFPPPVSHQQRTGKNLKPAPRKPVEKFVTEDEYATAMKEFVTEFDEFRSEYKEAMGELVEFMDMVRANMGFTPTQASISPETVEQSPEMIKAIKAMNTKPDSFWQTNLPA